jgi:hypothetical protein
MSKNFFFKFGGMLVFVVVALLWLLKALKVEAFDWFNLQWGIVIASGGLGIFYVLAGILSKTLGLIKKFYIYFGAGLIIVAVMVIINIYALDGNITLPIIGLIIAVALLLGIIVTGGKKWDQGDNKNVGYKNYHQRKAEEEKLKAKEEKNSNNK